MEPELTQIETLSLRDYIDKEMTNLSHKSIEMLEMETEVIMDNMTEIMSITSKLIALQDIAYRLEYGFITEIGNTSLKDHLVKP